VLAKNAFLGYNSHFFVMDCVKSITNNSLMVQENGFIRGVNPKSKIQNPKSDDL
jgi:hypothetical protein